MVELGYALSTEEHEPKDLIDLAARAERVGFEFTSVSDHYHPWISRQGNSPFVWSVLGGIAEATDELTVGTGVTCPIKRTHPAVVAQAAATTATLFEDRFFLGLGTGENLNEHVVGGRWPPFDERREMLREAVEIVRNLWDGEETTYRGEHFTVENARLYTVPENPPPIHLAASGPGSASLAGSIADGLITTSPDEDLVATYDGDGPRYGQVTVCWAETEAEAKSIAHEWWPNGAIEGELKQELSTPAHFEQAAAMVDEDDVASAVTCGPDVDRHVEAIEDFVDAGFDHVYVHQVGPDQGTFFDVYEEEVLPSFR